MNPPNPPAASMPFGEHLEELRSRLFVIVLTTGAVFALCMFFYRDLWQLAMFPRERAARWLGGTAAELFPLQFMRPTEGLSSAFDLALKIAVGLTLPIILTQLWLFVAPGLTPREKRAVKWTAVAGSGLFLLGAALAFLYAAPLGLSWLAHFDRTLSATVTQWRVDAYLDFIFMACLGFGLGFELPLAMAALAWTGLLPPEKIGRYWRQTLFALLIVAALFTPPDPYTMLLLATCLTALYGAGYWLARLVYKSRVES
ncbi:MAG: twin-arginine translocase subunit TatC [Planctomycetota bacterium]|jgi:sec-independent protein translocase protein TatC|nr:twin-arginine translocase subunit TatC [Planctomycetota bacterium]